MRQVLLIALITTAVFSCHYLGGTNNSLDSTVAIDTNTTNRIDTGKNGTGLGADSTTNGTGANSLSGMDSIKH